jgi:hypothetical protein
MTHTSSSSCVLSQTRLNLESGYRIDQCARTTSLPFITCMESWPNICCRCVAMALSKPFSCSVATSFLNSSARNGGD